MTAKHKGRPLCTVTIVDEAVDCMESGEDGLGICLHCFDVAQHGGWVEPDGRNRRCDNCDRCDVMGCEEIVLTFGGL